MKSRGLHWATSVSDDQLYQEALKAETPTSVTYEAGFVQRVVNNATVPAGKRSRRARRCLQIKALLDNEPGYLIAGATGRDLQAHGILLGFLIWALGPDGGPALKYWGQAAQDRSDHEAMERFTEWLWYLADNIEYGSIDPLGVEGRYAPYSNEPRLISAYHRVTILVESLQRYQKDLDLTQHGRWLLQYQDTLSTRILILHGRIRCR